MKFTQVLLRTAILVIAIISIEKPVQAAETPPFKLVSASPSWQGSEHISPYMNFKIKLTRKLKKRYLVFKVTGFNMSKHQGLGTWTETAIDTQEELPVGFFKELSINLTPGKGWPEYVCYSGPPKIKADLYWAEDDSDYIPEKWTKLRSFTKFSAD